MSQTDETLRPFFAPQGIALIGASQEPAKLGHGLARNLLASGYPGAIYFVNPKGGYLFKLPVYPNILGVPDPLDLAVLLVSPAATPEMLRACARRGLRAAVICASGFRESGPAGAAIETECLQIAREHGMRLIGPNSVGLIDTHLPLDATFLPQPPLPGEIAFISHSGAICAAVIDWARGQGAGFSRLVSLGNQADVNETDVLSTVAEDPFTKVATMYLEGVQDGRRFVAEATNASQLKPVIALKAGRFASGQRAAASHTGALAGAEDAYNAAFRRAGVLRARTTQEIFDWARALACSPLPRGRRVAVLTNAGGPGVAAADAIEENGLAFADLSQETHARLAEILPPAASLLNPVDMLASASPELYAACLGILLRDPGVDSVLVILPPPPMYPAAGVAQALIPVIQPADKPVLVALIGEALIQEAAEQLRAARIPDYRFPESAASALGVLTRRAVYLEQRAKMATSSTIYSSNPPNYQRAKAILGSIAPIQGATPPGPHPVPAEAAFQLLETYGIHTAPVILARSAPDAARAALRLGFPVALKIASPDILHKTEVNGVMLHLSDAGEVGSAFSQIIENASAARPDAQIDGVHLQRMIEAKHAVITGVIRDPQFGPLAMFGSGGIEVEGRKDVAFGLAPLNDLEAEEMLESTWAGRKLHGFRDQPPGDRDAALDALLRLAQLAADFPQISEIEINPLQVGTPGQGAHAVDVRLLIQPD